MQPQVVQERVVVSEGVQQVYEPPPQQSMQQPSFMRSAKQGGERLPFLSRFDVIT